MREGSFWTVHLSSHYLNRYCGIQQITADLYGPETELQLDITSTPEIGAEAFEFFVCIHVLEYMTDSYAAMRKFSNVLKPDGWGTPIVSIELDRTQINEENGLSEEN